jgi:two-component sensor histidine kinase
VKNNLQIVVSLLNLQAVRVKNPAALDTLQETGNRVRSMALLHETLYRSQNLAHVNFASYIESICNHLIHSYGPKAARVKLEQRMEEVSIDLDQAVACGLIINELVSNALKHAFPEGRAGRITVELQTAAQDQIVLRVADDGVGLPARLDLRQTETLGHQLVFMLAEKLRGAVEVTRDQGTAFRITFQTKQGDERL